MAFSQGKSTNFMEYIIEKEGGGDPPDKEGDSLSSSSSDSSSKIRHVDTNDKIVDHFEG